MYAPQHLGFRIRLHAHPHQAALPVVEGIDAGFAGEGRRPASSPRTGHRDAPERPLRCRRRKERHRGSRARASASVRPFSSRETGPELAMAAASVSARTATEASRPSRRSTVAAPSGRLAAEEAAGARFPADARRPRPRPDMRHGRRHGADRLLVLEAGEHDGHRRLRRRQDLEGDFGQEAERAVGAGQQLDQVEAGDVLHHPPAGLDDLAMAVDEAHAEQMVAGGTGGEAARTGGIGGEQAADGRLA